MAVKKYDARVQLKRDTSANWTANDPVLLNGELVLVDTANGNVRTKTGDGTKRYSQLPFDDETLYNAINAKCEASSSVAVTLRASGWNDGQQSVSVSGLKANQNGIAALPQDVTTDEYNAVTNAELYVSGQNTGTLIFTANGEVPQIDIPIIIILLG